MGERRNPIKMEKTKVKNLLLFAVVAALLMMFVVGSVYAFQYRNNTPTSDREAIQKAIESGDYEAWRSLHPGNGRMSSLITEDNFYLLKEMHEARKAGNIQKVWEIKEQLGFTPGFGRGKASGTMKAQGKGPNMFNCPYRT